MGECWLAIALSQGPQWPCPGRDAVMSGWTGWSVSAAHATTTGQVHCETAWFLPTSSATTTSLVPEKESTSTHATERTDEQPGGRRHDGQSRSEGLAVDFCPVKLERNRQRDRGSGRGGREEQRRKG